MPKQTTTPADTYRIINVFANGMTDDKGTVPRIHMIKDKMTCITTQVDKHYIDTVVHLKRDYSTVIHEIDGKINDVKFFI